MHGFTFFASVWYAYVSKPILALHRYMHTLLLLCKDQLSPAELRERSRVLYVWSSSAVLGLGVVFKADLRFLQLKCTPVYLQKFSYQSQHQADKILHPQLNDLLLLVFSSHSCFLSLKALVIQKLSYFTPTSDALWGLAEVTCNKLWVKNDFRSVCVLLDKVKPKSLLQPRSDTPEGTKLVPS